MHLSLLEHGAYTMLLDSFYAKDGFLPETHWVLFRLCRATTQEEQTAVAKVADEFFPVIDGRRTNARGQSEIDTAKPRILAAKLNGRKGGRPREKNPVGYEQETQSVSKTITQTEPNSKAIPTTNLHKKKGRGTTIPPDFSVSERVARWAEEKGFRHLDQYLEFFRGRMRASGKTYVDWDEAFMNCIREDWPALRKPSQSGVALGT